MIPVKVCHVATLTALGGVERILMDLLSHSHFNKSEHFLVATSTRPDLIKLITDKGFKCFTPTSRFRYDPGKLISIARIINNNHIDVVHSRNAYANSWANLSLTILRNPPKLITGEHGTAWSAQPPISWLDRLANQRAKLVVANSKASALMLENRYKIPSTKIRVLYNGIQIPNYPNVKEVRHLLDLPMDAEIIGSVGRLDTIKDFRTFVDAAEIVIRKRKNVLFILIGGGPQETFLRSLVESKEIQNGFKITGWRVDARSLIAGLDLYINTSIRESFGNTLIEAMMMKKPVIAPSVDGIPEAVQSGETGVLLEPTLPVKKIHTPGGSQYPRFVVRDGNLQPPLSLDPHFLADTIINLLDNPDLREEMGRKGRERATQLFNIERYASDLENIYQEVVE
ncbi:MAG: glycosyltransferase family 4 protein [Anaerolineales bacterium]|nr:glycosyltransferase family 4 protein [Anaerolineales bacterium]